MVIKLQARCKSCTKQISNAHGNANKEQRKKNRRKWYLENKEYDNYKSRQWQKENRERKREYDRQYYQLNKEKFVGYNNNRREINHNITDTEWLACKEYFNFQCAYCGLSEEDHKIFVGQQFHKEHVIVNGRNDLKNCVPSCRNCNCQKWEFSLNNWYNKSNPNYTYERYVKIYNWLRFDCHKHLERKTK